MDKNSLKVEDSETHALSTEPRGSLENDNQTPDRPPLPTFEQPAEVLDQAHQDYEDVPTHVEVHFHIYEMPRYPEPFAPLYVPHYLRDHVSFEDANPQLLYPLLFH